MSDIVSLNRPMRRRKAPARLPWADDATLPAATPVVAQLAGSRTACCTGCGSSYPLTDRSAALHHGAGGCTETEE